MPRHLMVVSHRVKTTPEEDDLVEYGNERADGHVLYVHHSFASAPDRRSAYEWYRDGRLVRKGRTRDYARLPEPLIYAKELIVTLRWGFRPGVRWDRYVGMDGLCTIFGLIIRAVRRAKNVSYWSLDFVPEQRFAARWKNAVYRRVNRFAALHANEMWDHNDLMVREKERVLGLTPAQYRVHRVVPLGLRMQRVPHYPYEACEPHTLVYMGSLIEKNGVQLVLRSIPAILTTVPDLRFKVIGGGPYEAQLKHLTSELGIEAAVIFTGRIERHEDLEEEVARSALAIAPYVPSLDTWTQFGGETTKVRVYLACGVPVLLTDIAWIAQQVEDAGAGELIRPEPADIAESVVHLLTDARANQQCRDAARALAGRFDDSRKVFDDIGV